MERFRNGLCIDYLPEFCFRNAMISPRSSALSTWKDMSLFGTRFSVFLSQLSNVSLLHVLLDFLRASEYWKESTDPAMRP